MFFIISFYSFDMNVFLLIVHDECIFVDTLSRKEFCQSYPSNGLRSQCMT